MRLFSIRPASFNGMVSLGNRIIKSKDDIFIFKTEFLRPFCVAYLDQIISSFNPNLKIYSSYPNVNQYLNQIKFPYTLASAPTNEIFPENYMIKLKRFNGDPNYLEDEVITWLDNEVFSKDFTPNFSRNLRKKIVENLWEIVFNAIQHSESENGISCCGQFYPQMGYFEIAFYDNGLGIPKLVRYFKNEFNRFSDYQCIVWSLQKGTSTKPELKTGGMGLYYLQRFLKLNGGWLQIVSHQGVFQSVGGNLLSPEKIKNFFQGTLFNLRIIYDEAVYKLKGE